MISGFWLVLLTNIITRGVELIQGASDSAVLCCAAKVLKTCCIIPIWNLHKSIFESETCLKELNEAIADGVWYVYWTYYIPIRYKQVGYVITKKPRKIRSHSRRDATKRLFKTLLLWLISSFRFIYFLNQKLFFIKVFEMLLILYYVIPLLYCVY